MIPEKAERIAMLKAAETLLRLAQLSYEQEENQRYEGGFVPEDGSLQSDDAGQLISLVGLLLDREVGDPV